MFLDLGIWDTLVGYRVKEVGGLYVSFFEKKELNVFKVLDACSRSKVQFDPHFGVDSVSHLIEDEAITKALYGKVIDKCPNVEIRTGVKVDSCILPKSLSEPATIRLSNGEEINTLLLVKFSNYS